MISIAMSFQMLEEASMLYQLQLLIIMKTQEYQFKSILTQKTKMKLFLQKGATEAINLVASTFGQKYLKKGDEVLLTELEHHSNYVPWHYLRNLKGVKIKFAEVNDDGEVSVESIEKKITSKTKIIAVTHLSNVTGAILPIKEITKLAHSKEFQF
ncbi:MAG: hypothetical protein Ct9H300mP5_2110 [Candidatus Pelagibacterales bacterium]|nr:MAG: hypothetical protein Ct9H300mP5_2110 [Pelagibacterales bacterium]